MQPIRTSLVCALLLAAAAAQEPSPLNLFGRAQSGESYKIVVPRDGQVVEIVVRDGRVLSAECKEQPVVVKTTKDGAARVVTKDGSEVLTIRTQGGDAVTNLLAARRPHLGVTMGRIDEALAAHLELDPEQVALVLDAPKDQPAYKAGIRKFDVIVGVDGAAPATEEKVREALRSKKPGDKLSLKINRHGKEQDLTVELGETSGLDLSYAPLMAYRSLQGANPLLIDASRRYQDALQLFGRAGGSADFKTFYSAWNKADADPFRTELEGIKQQIDRLDEMLKKLGERLKDK